MAPNDLEIPGITLQGLTVLSPAGPSGDPIWLAASLIDAAISRGRLAAGALNDVRCSPDRADWPARWQHLKDLTTTEGPSPWLATSLS
jgi:hypothetical protein